MRHVYTVCFLVVLWVTVSATPVHAATMDVTGFTTMTGDCTTQVLLRHNFSVTGTTNDTGGNRDVVALVLYDGNGTPFAYIGVSFNVGGSGTLTDFGWNYPILVQPETRPFTMRIFDNTVSVPTSSGDLAGAQTGTILDVVNFDPASFGICGNLPLADSASASVPNLPPFTDGRLNNWDTAAPIVPYGQDFDDERGLVVYSNEGVSLLVVRPEDLIACPAVNTLIASENGVSLYMLDTCEYQLMAPTVDGTKTYIMIFNGFYADTGYSSHEE